MLEDTTVNCPICDHEINIKTHIAGKKTTYLVTTDCGNCKTPANKLENLLNKSNKRSYVKVERSYIKLDPRG